MKETYLKHITVMVIGGGIILLCALGKLTGEDARILFAFILGYVFKNGYNGAKNVTAGGNITKNYAVEGEK